MNELKFMRVLVYVQVLVTSIQTNTDILEKGIKLEERLITDITQTWTTLATKISELEYIEQIGWHPANHPFTKIKYKVFSNLMTFSVATRNCAMHQGSLLHGDQDIIDSLEELQVNTKVWFSTHDTRNIRIMTEGEIQNFLNEVDTCYTAQKKENHDIEITHNECSVEQQSICIKLLRKYQETGQYKQEIENIKTLQHSMKKEDIPLVTAIGHLLKLGQPLVDRNHPAKLQQTINLLTSTASSITNMMTTMPILPNITNTMYHLQTTRNTVHTTVLLILAQHLINHKDEIDTLTSLSKTQTHADVVPNQAEEENNSATTDDMFETMLNIQQLETDMNRIRTDITNLQQVTQQFQTYYNNIDEMSQTLTKNKAYIASANRKIVDVSRRLTTWISQKATQALPDENPEEIETTVNNTMSSIAQFAIDFLEDETNIWIATTTTLILTIIAVATSIYMCIHIKKATRRNRTMKEHLQLSPKYTTKEDVEDKLTEPLTGTRIEKIEQRLLQHETKIKIIQQQLEDRPRSTNRYKKKTKKTAPQPTMT